jgi:tetratricopeptide (TPR) repeat protein
MKISPLWRNLILGAVAVTAFGSTIALSEYIRQYRVSVPESYADEDLDLQGKKLKGFALGFEGLIADWYWMRSLQYIGDKIENSKEETINLDNLQTLNPRLLYPLLDNATDLDPKFITAYSYGAVVLPAIDPSLAIKLTEKGIANNPDEWRLYQYLGYIYWRLKNYERAAQIYEQGSRIAGAPPFMKLMVGMMATRGGSHDAARRIYEQMRSDAGDENTRQVAELRLQWLDSLDDRDQLNSVLDSFKQRNSRCAKNLAELLPLLKSTRRTDGKDFQINQTGEIVDPSGTPYVLNTESCQIVLAPDSKLPKD